jgi:hypothetical protein
LFHAFGDFPGPACNPLHQKWRLVAGFQSFGWRVERCHAKPAFDSRIRHGGPPALPSYISSPCVPDWYGRECYYILYWKASDALHLDKKGKMTTVCTEKGRLVLPTIIGR